MEFFHEPNIDWMGKKWYFIALSVPLFLAGMISIAAHKGLKYGIDFRGGTLVTVKFAQAPNLDAIRGHLDQGGLHGATLQGYGPASDHEIIVGLDLKSASSGNALDAGKRDIIESLNALYGAGPPGKLDFNNADSKTIADHLITADPLHLASKGTEEATKTATQRSDRGLPGPECSARRNPRRFVRLEERLLPFVVCRDQCGDRRSQSRCGLASAGALCHSGGPWSDARLHLVPL
jgi:preprotein translocase subunit SecF